MKLVGGGPLPKSQNEHHHKQQQNVTDLTKRQIQIIMMIIDH